ncbi:carbonic anhydrase 1-like [Battus philenor]|uniref:carbonic anhydrase 1-like n=1 Tax=Battus philenor TaxID=42288 RepID=UPI0035CFEC6C
MVSGYTNDIPRPLTLQTGNLSKYIKENKWPGFKCNGGGTRQSPINIVRSEVVKDFERKFIKHGDLVFTGYQKVLLTAANNDYTIMFSTEGEAAGHPRMRGGPLRQDYRLEQMHLHWLSEHAIDGAKFPVEIHLVHVRSDLNVRAALKKKDGLAILALFCKITEHEDQIETAFDELTSTVSRLESVGSRVSGIVLNLTKLFDPKTSLYYTYAGSLTSPMCNEVVTWIIFPDHIYLTGAQYNLLEKMREGRYNYRSLQKIGPRVVYQPPADFLMEPQIVTSLKQALSAIVEYVSNLTSFMMNGLMTP